MNLILSAYRLYKRFVLNPVTVAKDPAVGRLLPGGGRQIQSCKKLTIYISGLAIVLKFFQTLCNKLPNLKATLV